MEIGAGLISIVLAVQYPSGSKTLYLVPASYSTGSMGLVIVTPTKALTPESFPTRDLAGCTLDLSVSGGIAKVGAATVAMKIWPADLSDPAVKSGTPLFEIPSRSLNLRGFSAGSVSVSGTIQRDAIFDGSICLDTSQTEKCIRGFEFLRAMGGQFFNYTDYEAFWKKQLAKKQKTTPGVFDATLVP